MKALGHISPRLGRMLSLPGRYMRGRGFGVHSPFAFSFITDVLRPDTRRYAYYGYETIDAMELPRSMRRMLRLWLRLAVAVRPDSIAICAASEPLARAVSETAAIAAPGARICRKPEPEAGVTWLAWIDTRSAGAPTPEAVAALINGDRGDCVLLTGPAHARLTASIEPLLSEGIIFAGGSATVIASRPHVPSQHLDIVI